MKKKKEFYKFRGETSLDISSSSLCFMSEEPGAPERKQLGKSEFSAKPGKEY